MAFVYILKSDSGKYYIGSTTNISERLRHHYGGYTPSTSKYGELKLVLQQEYETLRDARIIEVRLKKLKRKDYIDKIVKEGIIRILPR